MNYLLHGGVDKGAVAEVDEPSEEAVVEGPAFNRIWQAKS